MAAVARGERITTTAATKFNAPHSTLHDRVTGKVKVGTRCGPFSYLTINKLANFWFVVQE